MMLAVAVVTNILKSYCIFMQHIIMNFGYRSSVPRALSRALQKVCTWESSVLCFKFNLYDIHYCSPHLIYFENAIGKGIELRHYLGTRCELSLQKVCTWVKLSTLFQI